MKITKKVPSENARSGASEGVRGVLYLIMRFLRLLPVEGSVSEKCKIEEAMKMQKMPTDAKIGGHLIFYSFSKPMAKIPSESAWTHLFIRQFVFAQAIRKSGRVNNSRSNQGAHIPLYSSRTVTTPGYRPI